MSKQVKINGVTYKVRYTYTRPDGTVWMVLDCDGGLKGDFGDEWPAK
jgi:hypothetical protein